MDCNNLLTDYFKHLPIMGILSADQLWTLISSATLATIGLMSGDYSVILGSMLVSPLGTPIRYAALAYTEGKYQYIPSTILMLSFMTIIAFCFGYMSTLINNKYLKWFDLPSYDMEKLSNSMFLKVNFILGCVSGLAVPYAIKTNNLMMLAGLYISVAILPPLVNSGMYYRLYHEASDNIDAAKLKILSWNSFKITLVNWIGIGACSIVGFYIVCNKSK